MNMTELEFRAKVKAKIDEWFGGNDKYKLLYQWYDNGTAYVVAKTEVNTPMVRLSTPVIATTLYFLRLWEMSGIMELSQDKKVEL